MDTATTFNSDNMTDTVCSTACTASAYFAIAYGRDCWCGATLPTSSGTATCTFPNSGDNTQIGGSDLAPSVFRNAKAVVTPPETGAGGTTAPVGDATANPPVQGGEYLGCYNLVNTDGVPFFSWDKAADVDATGTTQETCQIYCTGYKYFALNNGNTCYCDNSVAFGDLTQDTPSGSRVNNDLYDVRAAGDDKEAAGGLNTLSTFQNPN